MNDALSTSDTEWMTDESKLWIAKSMLGGEDMHWGPFRSFAALCNWVDENLDHGVACVRLNDPDSPRETWTVQ